jgi:hypothetical protein
MTRSPSSWLVAALLLVGAPAVRASGAEGDVVVSIDKTGALHLEGDDLANEVQIDRDPATREYVVRGRNGTTVNGAVEARLPDAPSISATLGAGDDVLVIGGFRIRKRLTVDLGDGADRLSVTNTVVRGSTSVVGGTGDDVVGFEGRCDLRAGVRVTTGDGADAVRFADSYVRGPLKILTGNDDDKVEVHRCGLTRPASLLVGSGEGDDLVDLVGITCQSGGRIVTAGGADRVSVVTTRFVHDLTIDAGADDDDVTVDRATFDEKFRIQGGEGTNRVFVGAGVISGGGVTAGGSGHSGNWYWWFVIIHVY